LSFKRSTSTPFTFPERQVFPNCTSTFSPASTAYCSTYDDKNFRSAHGAANRPNSSENPTVSFRVIIITSTQIAATVRVNAFKARRK
jgi:hypothetical protein